jgi:hypothetical protein
MRAAVRPKARAKPLISMYPKVVPPSGRSIHSCLTQPVPQARIDPEPLPLNRASR